MKKCTLSRRIEGELVLTPNLSPIAKKVNISPLYETKCAKILPRSKTPSNEIYHKIYNLHEDLDRRMYTDQMGRFPTKSYRGMQYVMVLIKLDSKSILVEPMRDRTSGEMIQAYQVLVD